MSGVRSALVSERGFSLPELLVAMTLMLVVMTATLTTLDSAGHNRSLIDQRDDAVERARSTTDNIVRQLRNLASPSNATPNAIDRAQPNDFSFRTFDPNKKLIRYCLSDDPSVPETIYQMVLTGTGAVSYANCRRTTTGWSAIKVAAQNVVNARTNRQIFSYSGDTANTPTVKNVRIQLSIDVNGPNQNPARVRLASGAALRNQNQAPTARFTYAHQAFTRRFILNGTSSSDPEDRNLIYRWYAGQTATFTADPAHQIGVGVLLDYTFPTTTTNANNWYFRLIVTDSNLTDTCPTTAGVLGTNCSGAGPFNPFS